MNQKRAFSFAKSVLLLTGMLFAGCAWADRVICTVSDNNIKCAPSTLSYRFEIDMDYPIGAGTDTNARITFDGGAHVSDYIGKVCKLDAQVSLGEVEGTISCDGGLTAELDINNLTTQLSGPDQGTGGGFTW